eukprot:768449-Hanusia_phi.AAC.1
MSLSDVLTYLSQQPHELFCHADLPVFVHGTCVVCNLNGGRRGAAGDDEQGNWCFSAVISLDSVDGEGDLEIVEEEELRSHVPRCWVLCWRRDGSEGQAGAASDAAEVWRREGEAQVVDLLGELVKEATRVWIWKRCTAPKLQLSAWEIDAMLRRTSSYPLTRLDERLQHLLQLEAPWSQLLDDLATRHRSWSHVSSCRKWLLLLPAHEASSRTAVILTIRTCGDKSELQALICSCEGHEAEERREDQERREGREGRARSGREVGNKMEEAKLTWLRGIVTDICYWLWGLSL